MTKEQINTYTMRITQANTSGLAVVLYDMVLDYINESREPYENGETEEYERKLQQAQAGLQQLMQMSKMDTQVGCDVMSLYLFIDRQLLMSIVKRQPVHLTESIEYLNRLRAAFQEIHQADTDAPLMQNTQQVYAGLTYGRGYLNENSDPMEAHNRGLKA